MRRSWKEQGQLRSPGFRGGGGGRFVNNWVWCLWHVPGIAGLSGPGKTEYLDGGYPPPHGSGSHRRVGETRAYIGKGSLGGLAEGFEWNFKELVLVAAPAIGGHGTIELPLQLPSPWTVMEYAVPLVIFIYPILEPWIMDVVLDPLNGEPYTTYHQNAAAMPSGFLDPATGLVGTNAMAQYSAGQCLGYTPRADNFLTNPPADVISYDCLFQFGFNSNTGQGSSSGVPIGPYSRAAHIEISNPPSGTIYGIGLFAFSLYDYYMWTNDTDSIYLLSRGTIPAYINVMRHFQWGIALVPYQTPQSLTNETHIWESDDTGLTDAQLMALRTAGVYEQNEKALLVVM